VLADYYLKHENPTSAIAIYERMVEVNPGDPALRVKLADLYREMKLLDKALDEYRSIAETMLAAGAAEEAEQVYRKALDVDASDVGFITDAVLKLREAGQVGLAAHLLTQAVELNPEASRVARLVGLERPPTGEHLAVDGPEAGPAAETVAGAEAEEVERPPAGDVVGLGEDDEISFSDLEVAPTSAVEPAEMAAGDPSPEPPPEPSTAIGEESGAVPDAAAAPRFDEELDLDLDEVFALDLDDDEPLPDTQVRPPADLDDSATPAAAFRDRPAASSGALGVDPDVLERTAAEIQPERIRQEGDLLTEAEVLWKYGLAEKAAERLGELLAINPTNVGALALQVRFDVDRGAHGEAAAAASRLRTIADERSEAWIATAERLDAAGYQITAESVSPPADESGTLPGSPEEGLAAAVQEGEEEDGVDLVEDGDPFALSELELAVFPEDDVHPGDEASPSGSAAAGSHPPADLESSPPVAAEPQTEARPARRASPDIDSLLAEIESGVGSKRRPSPRRPRDEPDATGTEPEIAPAESSAPSAAPDRAAAISAESVDWLQEVERATERIGPEGETGGDEFFAAEDDFFDLAAELEQELSREGELDDEELLLAQPREQTLEEIVDGFKRGVAETLSTEDHATHFDLGIAYREMGLLDEAIGEFQIAAKAPELLVSCCSMLGLSFLEKGLPELAVKWYRRGLEAPGLGEEDQLGLLYDLGNALVAVGDSDAAYHRFVELYGINSHYRDVVARLEETRPAS
jgi:tetratricopeptide (TPR) repeat protein